jgi:uncharacterized protein YbcI
MTGGIESASGAAEIIAREIEQVQLESYGVGAESTTVTIDEDLVVVILETQLAPFEQTLLDAGRPEAIKDVRSNYQHAIGATFSAIVERATGRRVVSFLSSMSIEPLYAVELFRLGPAAD